MALKSLDIFSVHGFPVGLVQCESNLLGIVNGAGSNVGSGGWTNIVNKYVKAKRWRGGGYRKPDLAARVLSLLSESSFKRFFRQIWTDIPGESTRGHPAPYPLALADRLIRMFSFVGDTVRVTW